jgi:hypothetical protein
MNPTLEDFSNLLRDAARQSPGCDCTQLQAYRWQPEGYGRELSMEAFGATSCDSVEFWSRICEEKGELLADFPALFMFVQDWSEKNPFQVRTKTTYRIQLSVLGKLVQDKKMCGECNNLTPNSLTSLSKTLLKYVLSYIGGAVYASVTRLDGKVGQGLYNLKNLQALKDANLITDFNVIFAWYSSLPIEVTGEDIIFKTGETYGTSATISLSFTECDPEQPTLMLPLIKECEAVETECCG